MRVPVVPLAELSCGATAVFALEVDGERDQGFVVRLPSGELRAYVNRCRHANLPLDWADGQFLDEGGLLACRAHGARFLPDDGLCVAGPCLGKKLRPIRVEVDAGVVIATAVANPVPRHGAPHGD
jgi:nitrite reductase/ring-hydroxylating ferredoxin subunit